MITERFMVTGKRLDNGETVTGYLGPHNRSEPTFGNWYIVIDEPDKGWHYSVNVDIETIEPVAANPIKDMVTDTVADVKCPMCKEKIFRCYMPTPYHGWNESQISHKYCMNCGQRLDWSEEQ